MKDTLTTRDKAIMILDAIHNASLKVGETVEDMHLRTITEVLDKMEKKENSQYIEPFLQEIFQTFWEVQLLVITNPFKKFIIRKNLNFLKQASQEGNQNYREILESRKAEYACSRKELERVSIFELDWLTEAVHLLEWMEIFFRRFLGIRK